MVCFVYQNCHSLRGIVVTMHRRKGSPIIFEKPPQAGNVAKETTTPLHRGILQAPASFNLTSVEAKLGRSYE